MLFQIDYQELKLDVFGLVSEKLNWKMTGHQDYYPIFYKTQPSLNSKKLSCELEADRVSILEVRAILGRWKIQNF